MHLQHGGRRHHNAGAAVVQRACEVLHVLEHERVRRLQQQYSTTCRIVKRCDVVQADALLGRHAHVGQQTSVRNWWVGDGKIYEPLGFSAQDLEGGLDVAVHHLDVRLVDGHRAAGEGAGLVDGHGAQLWEPLPVLLQDQQQLLQP